jgi:molecular chaperone DnaK (HSP70)
VEAYSLNGGARRVLPTREVTEATTFDIGVAAHQMGDSDPTRLYVGQLIPAGTSLPAEATEAFGVASRPGDSGSPAELIICEGQEGEEYREELKVQSFSLADLPPSDDPSRKRLEVTITVDESGIIMCRAVDLETGKSIERRVSRKATA